MTALHGDGFAAHQAPDLFELVEADHRRLHGLIHEATGDDGEGVPDWRPVHRRKVVQRLIIEASRHEVAEEEFFWPAVRFKVDLSDELREAGLTQEQQAKRLLRRLDRAAAAPTGEGGDDAPLEALLAEAVSALRDHMLFEETEVLPRLRAEVGDIMSRRLGSWFEWGSRRAPTRPHPHTPPIPGLLRSHGRMVSLTDRARDFVTRRGRG